MFICLGNKSQSGSAIGDLAILMNKEKTGSFSPCTLLATSDSQMNCSQQPANYNDDLKYSELLFLTFYVHGCIL